MDGALAALAGYEVCGHRHPPGAPRAAAGAAAVALAAETAPRAGLIAQSRTLASNTPSIRIARRLGFAGYATSLAVRLHAE